MKMGLSSSILEKGKHLHVVNLIKALSLLAIVIFHANEFIFYKDDYPFEKGPFLYSILFSFAKLIPFSGHSLVTTVFFLWGYHQFTLKRLLRNIPILLLGQMVLMLSFFENNRLSLEWDIYGFLAVAILLLPLLERCSLRALLLASTTFVVATFVSPPNFLNEMPISFLLVGDCHKGGSGAWPLYPWIGLLPFGYTLGRLVHSHVWSWKKYGMVILFLSWTPFFWGSLSPIPMGPNYYCFAFYAPPLKFWAHFLGVPCLLLLSKNEKLQNFLDKITLIKFLSRSRWNQRLGMCYLIQISIFAMASFFRSTFEKNPLFFEVFFLLIFPLVEYLVRLIEKLYPSKK